MTTGRHNLFLAIQPDEEAIAAVGRLRRERQFDGRPIRPNCLHISLVSLGRHDDLPHELIERAAIALSAVTMSRFVVALNHLVSWKGRPGERPLVLVGDEGVIGVDMLIVQIRAALVQRGLEPKGISQTPHLTLAYGGRELPGENVAPVQWMVREFVLIDSLVGEGRHVVLNRWPLASADGALSGTPSSPYEGVEIDRHPTS